MNIRELRKNNAGFAGTVAGVAGAGSAADAGVSPAANRALAHKAKAYLLRVQSAQRLTNMMEETLQELRGSLEHATSRISECKTSGSSAGGGMAEAVLKAVYLENELKAQMNRMLDLKREALMLICALPEISHQSVLIARYFQYKEWEEVAADMGYSQSHVYRLHGWALAELGGRM